MIRHDREEEEEEEGKKTPAKKTNMYYFITASTLTFDKHLERILKQDDLDAVVNAQVGSGLFYLKVHEQWHIWYFWTADDQTIPMGCRI